MKRSAFPLVCNPPIGTADSSGKFEYGAEGISGFYKTPNPNTVCCILQGLAYWVPVLSPTSYQVIPSTPVKSIIPILNLKLLIFIDYTRLTAFNESGLAWRTASISWDDIQIDSVDAEYVRGRGWDSPREEFAPFTVELRTGAVQGGSSPSQYGVDY